MDHDDVEEVQEGEVVDGLPVITESGVVEERAPISVPAFLRFLAAFLVRWRETTATVAAPQTKPVAASAATWTAGTLTCARSSTTPESVITGRPSTTSASCTSSTSSRSTNYRPYRPRRTCIVPNTRSQYGALIPKPRSSSWK